MNYSQILNNISDWMARNDLEGAAQYFVSLTETRLNRVLRIRQMERSIVAQLAQDQTVNVPADYIEAKNFYLFQQNGTPPGGGTAGPPYSFADLANIFGTPTFHLERTSNELAYRDQVESLSGIYYLGGMYYAKPAALSAENVNGLYTQVADDALFFGAMREAYLYNKNPEQSAVWDERFAAAVNELNTASKRESMSGSMLTQQIAGNSSRFRQHLKRYFVTIGDKFYIR
jgi:hypothetical protein